LSVLIFHHHTITMAATPEQIQAAQYALQQKKESLLALINGKPFSPIASEDVPELEELTEALQSAIDKIEPYAEEE